MQAYGLTSMDVEVVEQGLAHSHGTSRGVGFHWQVSSVLLRQLLQSCDGGLNGAQECVRVYHGFTMQHCFLLLHARHGSA